jgi:hypothetical protein
MYFLSTQNTHRIGSGKPNKFDLIEFYFEVRHSIFETHCFMPLYTSKTFLQLFYDQYSDSFHCSHTFF